MGLGDWIKAITQKQKEEIKNNPLIFGDNKDIMLHKFKYHERIEDNVLMAYWEDNKTAKDFVFRHMRLGNLMYNSLNLRDDKILENIRGKYLTYNPQTKEIVLKGMNEKLRELNKEELLMELAEIKQTCIIEAQEIKSTLYNDVDKQAIVNRNKEDNPATHLGTISDAEDIMNEKEEERAKEIKIKTGNKK